jgi:hypothetical protein
LKPDIAEHEIITEFEELTKYSAGTTVYSLKHNAYVEIVRESVLNPTEYVCKLSTKEEISITREELT